MTDMVYNLVFAHNLEGSILLRDGPDSARPREELPLSTFGSMYGRFRSMMGEVSDVLEPSLGDSFMGKTTWKEHKGGVHERLEEVHSQKCCPGKNGNYVPGNYGFKGGWASYFPMMDSKARIRLSRKKKQYNTRIAWRTYRKRHRHGF